MIFLIDPLCRKSGRQNPCTGDERFMQKNTVCKLIDCCRQCFYPRYQTSILAAVVNKKHTTIPVTVGTRKEAIVHFTLCVSFLIVRHVVEQGQCIRENSMVLTAVIQVQPWLTSKSRSTDRSLISSRLPSAR